jgi:hypothetical protein
MQDGAVEVDDKGVEKRKGNYITDVKSGDFPNENEQY